MWLTTEFTNLKVCGSNKVVSNWKCHWDIRIMDYWLQLSCVQPNSPIFFSFLNIYIFLLYNNSLCRQANEWPNATAKTSRFHSYYKLLTNLATLRQSPLKPTTIWRVDATIRAPWVPRIIFSNFCIYITNQVNQDYDIKTIAVHNNQTSWDPTNKPPEDLKCHCIDLPKWLKSLLAHRYKKLQSQRVDESQKTFETTCSNPPQTILSESFSLSPPKTKNCILNYGSWHI